MAIEESIADVVVLGSRVLVLGRGRGRGEIWMGDALGVEDNDDFKFFI